MKTLFSTEFPIALALQLIFLVSQKKASAKKLKLSLKNLFKVRKSNEMLSTGMPEVFGNENSLVYRRIVNGDVHCGNWY